MVPVKILNSQINNDMSLVNTTPQSNFYQWSYKTTDMPHLESVFDDCIDIFFEPTTNTVDAICIKYQPLDYLCEHFLDIINNIIDNAPDSYSDTFDEYLLMYNNVGGFYRLFLKIKSVDLGVNIDDFNKDVGEFLLYFHRSLCQNPQTSAMASTDKGFKVKQVLNFA